METKERPLCACGCGQKVNLVPWDNHVKGIVAGQPYRFLHHHQPRGASSPSWKGGRVTNTHGYILTSAPAHPRADQSGYVPEHILVAEAVLRNYLPPRAVVHHVNEDKTDNRRENLVICQDNYYHLLLHQRLRALRACGHADWRKCKVCGQYDALSNLALSQPANTRESITWHRSCHAAYERARQARQKMEVPYEPRSDRTG